MTSAAILKLEKSPTEATVTPETSNMKSAAADEGAAKTAAQRRELAILLRSIKTMVRQSDQIL